MDEKIRLSLDVTHEMYAIIDGLSAGMGITHGETLRRAIALLKAAESAKKDGMELATLRDGNVYARLIWY